MSLALLTQMQQKYSSLQGALNENPAAAWQSPSNIALVKYWGKKDGQHPVNPSLSMTLTRAFTRTQVNARAGDPGKGLVTVNGDPGHPFISRMQQLVQWMSGELPALLNYTFTAVTENSFPHSTGIASSASGISAFTLCMLEIASKIVNSAFDPGEFMKTASCIARTGSGSAGRSLYGGYSVWGQSSAVTGSSDDFAVPVTQGIHPEMMHLKDAILVISSDRKSLPSSRGHQAMEGHPFSAGRILQANQNLENALQALSRNDLEKLGTVSECEALTLHALIMSSNPGTVLMKPGTVEAICRVREARKTGLPVFFTLDAGASVHVIYPGHAAPEVEKFIAEALQPLCENGRVIYDLCGAGPVKQDQSPIAP